MKGFFLMLFFMTATLFSPLGAQQKEDIVKALMAGKAEVLCANMSSNCELILPSGTWNSGSACNRLSACYPLSHRHIMLKRRVTATS